TSPIGVSQMPTTRSPSTVRIASVTIPAGLVKLMTQAPGAACATVRAMSRATGIVRNAKARPPGPIVSWPSSPRARATRPSTVPASAPPPRTAENPESAGDGLAQVGGGGQPGQGRAVPVGPQALGDPLDHGGDGAQARGVDVVQ